MERTCEFRRPDHGDHPLEWQLGDTCLLCLMKGIERQAQGQIGSSLTVHRRFALSLLIKNLRLEPNLNLTPRQLTTHQNLIHLLRSNRHVSAKVVIGLLNALDSNDVADLAIEAIYRLYHNVRDEGLLDSVLTHCFQALNDNLLEDPDLWPPYLGLLQRFARLNPASVGRRLSQYGAFERKITEHLSDFSEYVTLHSVALLDPLLRSADLWILRRKYLQFVPELATILKRSDSKQLQGAVLRLLQILLSKEESDMGESRDQIHLIVINALKKVILQSQLEIQMAALEVLEILLWRQSQSGDGRAITELVLGQDMAELIYEVLYSNQEAQLLECALRCLQNLSRCPLFFQNRYLILGLEPVLRVTPYLLENNGTEIVVASTVQLLADMISRYEGEDSLLNLLSTRNGLHVTTSIAVHSLKSSSFHLQISGAHLMASLLNGKQLGLPLPLDPVTHLVQVAYQHLSQALINEKMDSKQFHLTAVIQILSAAVQLISDYAEQPGASLESYATATQPPSGVDESFNQFNNFVIGKVDELLKMFSAWRQSSGRELQWSELWRIMIRLAEASQAGSSYVEEKLRAGPFLRHCFQMRDVDEIKETADDVLTWFLGRMLRDGHPLPSSPFVTLKELIQQIPTGIEDLGPWLAHNQEATFAAKAAALVLIYHIELGQPSNERVLMADPHGDDFLSAVAHLLLTISPSGLDNANILRPLWFLVAKYDGGRVQEASKALARLMKWLQPNRVLLPDWLRPIYTHDPCLLRWTFSFHEAAVHLGPAAIRLWIDNEQGQNRGQYLIQMASEQSDDTLLSSLFDLIFEGDDTVSLEMASVLERIAQSNRNTGARVGRLVKCNVPRMLRWTDVQGSTTRNHGRLVGALRLLFRLSGAHDESSSAWADPAVVAAVVSFIPRAIGDGRQDRPLQPTVTAIDLWCWGCRYLSALLSAARKDSNGPAVRIVMENSAFIQFLNRLMEQDQLPVWPDVARLVVAMAAIYRPNYPDAGQVTSIRVSTVKLAKKLTLGVKSPIPVDTILQLLLHLLRGNFQQGFLIDPKLSQHYEVEASPRTAATAPPPKRQRPLCSDLEDVLEHLWISLLNWTLRIEPSAETFLFQCLTQLMRFCRLRMAPTSFGRLMALPWNYLCLLHAIDCWPGPGSRKVPSCPVAVQLANDVMAFDQQQPRKHPWAAQLLEALKRNGRTSPARPDPSDQRGDLNSVVNQEAEGQTAPLVCVDGRAWNRVGH